MSSDTGSDGHHPQPKNNRELALLALGAAYQRFGVALEQQQEVLAGIADLMMRALVMESVVLRGRASSADYVRVYTEEAIQDAERIARAVFTACTEGDTLRTSLAVLRRFTRYEPTDLYAVRRRIAGRLLEAGRYVV